MQEKSKTRVAVGAIVRYGDKYLLVNKVRNHTIQDKLPKNGIWDFVKGGVKENETLEEAVLRELKEELGSDNFRILERVGKTLYFKFPNTISNSEYMDQITHFFIVEFLGTDSALKVDNYEIVNWGIFEYQEVINRLTHEETKRYIESLTAQSVRGAGRGPVDVAISGRDIETIIREMIREDNQCL